MSTVKTTTASVWRLALVQIVADELDHAELAAAVCAATGIQQQPQIPQEKLGERRRYELLLEDVVRVCVRSFCLGETVAVPLFKEMRAECTEDAPKGALDRILKDEVRHRQFGWDLLEHLIDTWPEAKAFAEKHLEPSFLDFFGSYGSARLDQISMKPEYRSWGLMPPAHYRIIFKETFPREYEPRFAVLGINAKPAWQAARDSARS